MSEYMIEYSCVTCGKKFERYRSQAPGVYCQRACRTTNDADRMCAQTCVHCDAPFQPASGRQKYCTTCVPNKCARMRLIRYGVSDPEWQTMLARFDGKCWVRACDRRADMLDHDHESGLNRGALCRRCNVALHLFDSPDLMASATAYMASSREFETWIADFKEMKHAIRQ